MTGDKTELWTAGCWALAVATIPQAAFAQASAASPAESRSGEIAAPAGEASPAPKEGLQDIVVTATRRAQDVQDVPVAVTAMSDAQLTRLQVADVFDLNRTVPNLIITETAGGSTVPGIVIRGIGLIDFTWNAESGVGLYVDDAYVPGELGTAFDFIDIERIEVLRGPQGTLYGRNSTSGAVKVMVRRPNLERVTFKADATAGSRERSDVRGSVSVPLVDGKLGLKLDGVYHSQNGYVVNRTLRNHAGDVERGSARAALLWRPSSSFEAYLIGTYGKEDSGISLSTPTRYDFASQRHIPVFGRNVGESGLGVRNVNDLESKDANLQLTWDTAVGMFKSISAYRDVDSVISGDLDGTFAGTPIPGGFGFLNIDFDQSYHDKLFTQELQWHERIGDKLDAIVGAYLFDRRTRQDTWTKLFYPQGMRQVARQNARSYAAYLDVTYDIADKLQLFGGLRWTTERKRVDHTGAIATTIGIQDPFDKAPFPGATLFDFNDVHRRWSDLSHRIGAKYRFGDDIMVYVSRSRGFKPGQIMSSRGPDSINSGLFTDKETSTTYEAGLRSKLFSNTVLFNLTGYYQQYKDLQTGSLQVNVLTRSVDVDIAGAELEAQWLPPIDGLQLFATAGLNKPDFAQPGLVLKDAPESNFSLGFTFERPLGDWTAGFGSTYFWQDDVYYGNIVPAETRLQKAYGTFDAQAFAQTGSGRVRIGVGVKNLLDKHYTTLGNELFGLPASVDPLPFAQRYYNPGRQWSLSLRYTM